MSEWNPQKLLRAVQKQKQNDNEVVAVNQRKSAHAMLSDYLPHETERQPNVKFAEHHQGGFRTPAQVVHVALQEPEPVSAPRKPYYEMWGLVKATGLFMSLGLLLGGVFMYGMSTIHR